MKWYLTVTAIAFAIVTSATSFAEQKTVTLKVKNMTCASCIYTVSSSLEKVQGVSKAKVSYDKRTATVTYDDTKTTSNELTKATKNAGFPSKVIRKGK